MNKLELYQADVVVEAHVNDEEGVALKFALETESVPEDVARKILVAIGIFGHGRTNCPKRVWKGAIGGQHFAGTKLRSGPWKMKLISSILKNVGSLLSF